MAVMRCPSCGELSLTAVDRCPGCGADMAAVAAPERPAAAASRAPNEQERRELHEWTMEGRRLLDGMLQRAGIPRTWQGTILITPDNEHDRVEEMVDLVGVGDARVGQDEEPEERPADRSGDEAVRDDDGERDGDGDDDGDEVAYDLTGWSDLARGDLVAALAEAGIAHGWDDDGDLVVAGRDETRVDRIFEQLTDGGGASDDLPDDNFFGEVDDDGMLVQETLSDLFVGSDRLLHNPLDGTAARLVIEARDHARTLRLPFGFERTQWRAILDAAEELADSFVPGGLDDDAIRERSSRLRGLLRDVV